MDAIVIAGGTPKIGSPLYPYSQGKPKAMIDISGRPMIWWVLNALSKAKTVDELIVVGLDDVEDQDSISQAVQQPIHFLPNTGSLVGNGLAGLDYVKSNRGEHQTVIGCSSDIPHMEPHMIDDLVERCAPFDRILYYGAVTPEVMQAAYPAAERTFANLAGERLAGCDIFVSTTRLLETDRELWHKVLNARKNPLAMAWAVGFWPLLKLATGRLSVADAAALAGRLLEDDRPIGVAYTPYAQLAMDGDKPHQIDLLRKTIKNW